MKQRTGERRDHIMSNRGSREEGDEILRLKAADGEYQYRGRCRTGQ